MPSNLDENRACENTSLPSCWARGLGIPRLSALLGVSTTGDRRFVLRVRESLTPRANKNVALTVRFFVTKCSAPIVPISLREVCKFGSAVNMDGRIEGRAVTALPPRAD